MIGEWKMGIWCIDDRGNEYLLKSTMRNQMQFIIYENPECGWYVYNNVNDKYLHKNLKFYDSIYGSNYGCGSAPGYYDSKRKA